MNEVGLERLEEFRLAWRDADERYHDDIVAAHGDRALQDAIDANWYNHQKNWADAGVAALEVGSPAVDLAHKAAKAANQAVTKARTDAENIAKIIRKSAKAAETLLGELKAITDA